MRRLLIILALLITIPAHAAPEVSGLKLSDEPALPKPLREQRDRGAQVFYLGKFEQLYGWAMIRSGQPEFYYATEDNKALVMGILFNDKGDMLTGEQLKALEISRNKDIVTMMESQMAPNPRGESPKDVPMPEDPAAGMTKPADVAANLPPIKPDAEAAATAPQETSPAKKMLADVQAASSVLWGKPGVPAFWAFLDPNCAHCRQFIKDVDPMVTAGKVAVHIVPVAYDSKSKSQAALVLAAADGADRLVAYSKGQENLLPASDTINTSTIQTNLELMRKWSLSGTPIIVYQSGKGGTVRLIRGRPLDINQAVGDLLGQEGNK